MEGKKHVKFAGRLVVVGFGSVGQGTLPLLLRHIDMPPDRISIVTGDERGRAEAAHYGIKFQVTTAHARDTSRDPRALDRQGRFPAQSLGRRFQRSADRALLREGGDVPRYVHRAVAGRLHRSESLSVPSLELRAARGGAGAAQEVSERRTDRDPDSRGQPRPHFALGQAGAREHRPRRQRRGRNSAIARSVGAACDGARRESHTLRRARHAGRGSAASAASSS